MRTHKSIDVCLKPETYTSILGMVDRGLEKIITLSFQFLILLSSSCSLGMEHIMLQRKGKDGSFLAI